MKAFGKYLDDNPDAGQICRRWQLQGCNLPGIAKAFIRFVLNYPNGILGRKRETTIILSRAISALTGLEKLSRTYKWSEADHFASDVRLLTEWLAKVQAAFDSRRKGNRDWRDLALVEGFVFEATETRPTPMELVVLIKAAYHAVGKVSPPWDLNPQLISKGLKTFKKNNAQESIFWTKPSLLRLIAS